MKVYLKNLGALKQAEFSLGEMTILCGGNNTGKTYATYALFGFLSVWRENFSIYISDQKIDQLLSDGTIHIDITEYRKRIPDIITKGCVSYTKQLPMIFAAPPERFKESLFNVEIDSDDVFSTGKYERRMRAANAELFAINKLEMSNDLVVTLLIDKARAKIPQEVIKQIISDALKDVIFGHLFPNPFIASAERTGAAIFRKELNFARNRLLEEMSQSDKNVNPMELLFKVYQDYALPVKANVDFTRQIETLAKKTSFIAEKHPDILVDFSDIIGGEYTVTRNDELYYIPKGKRVKLTMDESSSAVRSLLDIGFYLKHLAKQGDLLIVDEPELNLHPENQRRVARLFSRLVNLGIKVFMTTHSDYIIKELNTLIMLNHDRQHLKEIAQREGYKAEELINSEKIRVYIAEESQVKLDGGQRKTRCQTLTLASIDPELGIEARSFDATIEAMNRIQEEIVWGER
ncbi:AAA family ATPase [Nitrosomonas nitrosa]|uniref:AAA ATPase domain-containing protein n=1 Tax=Nitrosomonas nitrosa TaxID=52442 RepID=A0A1I4U7U0_9PROT|nr:AAA family ATPase [Nitrosomonas nitrosa]MCO6433799.1 AAA family ATPase [Nitrosomonas nitrosa]SFM84901.1 AAA ATPase domain-containing protein [Nitrosomonas nitrosa]